ncbi:MAG: carbohydrate ABC transporter permease [Clostridiales bacterium]|nr:carbohydrate ABC transporter permease [Clostridiales bacterium]
MGKSGAGFSFGKIAQGAVLAIFAVFVIYPLFFVLLTSLKVNTDVILNPFGISSFEPQNYITAWTVGKVGKYLFSSVVTTFAALAIQMGIIVLASYSFGKLKPWGSKILFPIILMGMFVSSEMTTVPNYMTIKNMGLMSTRWALILPYAAGGLIMGTYILTNFIRALPQELDEAARIDGAGVFDIMLLVDLPLIVPALATLVIYNFNGVWSEFYWALIVVKDDRLKTLPLGLINFQSQFTSNYGVLTAGLVILTVPVIVVYLFFSKYFIAGISAGAVKG